MWHVYCGGGMGGGEGTVLRGTAQEEWSSVSGAQLAVVGGF